MSEIEVRNLYKTFTDSENKVEALKNINLDIEAGDIYGVIGMSGAGKSTFVRCINFLEVPTSGSVVIRGQDLSKLSEKELREERREIGMIFQNFNLLMQKNIIKNIMFPLELAGKSKEEAKKRAKELLKVVGLEEKEKAYPSQLSGGQKQRVAIARALALNPKILLCDEATSALDPQTTSSILDLLKELNKSLGITIIIITHQMSVVSQICNKVAIIDDGELVENGLVRKIFAHPKSRAAKEIISRDIPEVGGINNIVKDKKIRIVFSEDSAFEPIISNIVLKFNTNINILKANTRDVGGCDMGEMLISLGGDDNLRKEVMEYLQERGIESEEVDK